jgi:hypothetical protein
MRLQLKELLITEYHYKVLKSVTEEQNLDGAMIKLEKAIPCLLHLENRISEAMLMYLLPKGLSIREGNRPACDDLMCAVERCMNEIFSVCQRLQQLGSFLSMMTTPWEI